MLKIPMMSYYSGSGMAKCGTADGITPWKNPSILLGLINHNASFITN